MVTKLLLAHPPPNTRYLAYWNKNQLNNLDQRYFPNSCYKLYTFKTVGWYRVGQVSHGTNFPIGTTLTIKKDYHNSVPEDYQVQILVGYNKSKIKSIYTYGSSTPSIKKIRFVISTIKYGYGGPSYIDIYYTPPGGNSEEYFLLDLSIIQSPRLDYYEWALINANVVDETIENEKVLSTFEIPTTDTWLGETI